MSNKKSEYITYEEVQEKDIIKYKNAYVAFVDVLGFKEIVLQENTSTVSSYYRVIDESISELSEALKEYGIINSQIMSDSIVFSVTPKSENKTDKIKSVRALCGAIAYLQFYLSIHGIWTRGGISYGGISFHNERFVVGPALVTAVELEKISKYPRIVLEPRILQNLGIGKAAFIKEMTITGDEGSLCWVFNDSETQQAEFKDLLFVNFGMNIYNGLKFNTQAAQVIAEQLQKGLYGSPAHLEKYRWLQAYFLNLPLASEAKKYFSEI